MSYDFTSYPDKLYKVLQKSSEAATGFSYEWSEECGDGCCSWREDDFEMCAAGTVVIVNGYSEQITSPYLGDKGPYYLLTNTDNVKRIS